MAKKPTPIELITGAVGPSKSDVMLDAVTVIQRCKHEGVRLWADESAMASTP